MAHFTYIKTQIKERELLLKAIRDLGFSYTQPKETSILYVYGSGGRRTHVEIKVFTRSADYDIGFRKRDGVYELVADWWGIRSITRQEFLKRLAQRYAYHAMCTRITQQGYTILAEELRMEGEVQLVLQKTS